MFISGDCSLLLAQLMSRRTVDYFKFGKVGQIVENSIERFKMPNQESKGLRLFFLFSFASLVSFYTKSHRIGSDTLKGMLQKILACLWHNLSQLTFTKAHMKNIGFAWQVFVVHKKIPDRCVVYGCPNTSWFMWMRQVRYSFLIWNELLVSRPLRCAIRILPAHIIENNLRSPNLPYNLLSNVFCSIHFNKKKSCQAL